MKKITTNMYQAEDERKIDYKLEEFRKKNKITKTYFKNNVNKYKNHFDINVEEIKNFDGESNYNIPFLAEPIMGLMFKNFKFNPLVDGRRNKNNIPIERLIEYNKKIFEDIDRLPNDIKYNIKSTSTYEFNYVLNEAIPIILDKMSILFSLIISESSVSAGNPYRDLIDSLDSWIANFIEHSIELEKKQNEIENEKILMVNIGTFGSVNFEKNSTYIMDKILKDEYVNNIKKVDLLKDRLKIDGTESLFEYLECTLKNNVIDKSKIDRGKLIKWINNEENNEVDNYESLLSDRECYLEKFKSSLNIDKISEDSIEYKNEQIISNIKDTIISELENLQNECSDYREIVNTIDKILHGENFDIHTIMLYNKIKIIVNSKEYKLIVEQNFNASDQDYDKFDILIKKLAEDLWIETYKDRYEKVNKIKDIVDNKYKEFEDKNSQLNLIRLYLSKAIGQTITPTLQKEIKELSKEINKK